MLSIARANLVVRWNQWYGENTMDQQKTTAQLRSAVRKQTIGFMTAGFSLVAGLAWNDAIQSMIKWIWPAEEGGSIAAKFLYAAIVTCVIVVITVQLQKLAEKE